MEIETEVTITDTMKIHISAEEAMNAIYDDISELTSKLQEKREKARATAKTAYKRGNRKKWDKFNFVARGYEMTLNELYAIRDDLFKHVSEDFEKDEIPF